MLPESLMPNATLKSVTELSMNALLKAILDDDRSKVERLLKANWQ